MYIRLLVATFAVSMIFLTSIGFGYRKSTEGNEVVKRKLYPKNGTVEINGLNVGAIINQNVLTIPRKYASVELTNTVLHVSDTEILEKIDLYKTDTIQYDFDVAGLQYLVDRLKELGETQKGELIESQLYK